MAALYPKKTAPFNQTEMRMKNGSSNKVVQPGPGSYENTSTFEKTIVLKGLQNKDSFLVNDNGHLN
jgi:hypothetical protein